jgi:5-methylcytosine-specific restriction endonuclease McrA
VREYNLRRRAALAACVERYTEEDVQQLRIDQGGRCRYCARVMEPSGSKSPLRETVDHWIALARGGSNGPGDIVLACLECNLAKHAAPAEYFLGRRDRPGVLDPAGFNSLP